MFSFEYPYILFAIPCILLVWYVFFRERIGHFLPNPIMKGYLQHDPLFLLLWLIRSLLISSLMLAITGISISVLGKKETHIHSKTIIVLDISRSMLAEDMLPNRITSAKSVIETFVRKSANTEIGVILFAGRPFSSIPFSNDREGIVAFIRNVSPYFIRQERVELSGTAIGDALLLAKDLLAKEVAPIKNIILITDGKTNIGIDPHKVIPELAQHNIRTFAVGIWGPTGQDMYYTHNGKKTYFYDEQGNTLKNDVDEALLQELTKATGWAFYRSENTETLIERFQQLTSDVTPKIQENIEYRKTKLDIIFLLVWVCFYFWERYIRRSIWKKYHLLGQ